MSEKTYSHVRALSRGLDILAALNRMGQGTPREVSAAVGVDRSSVYRLLSTLCDLGYVTVGPKAGSYKPTAKVRQLSDGFTDRDAITRIVAPELGQLLQSVLWPSDYAVFEDGEMVIRESTHSFSVFSIHRAMIGRSRPVLKTALGRAVVAASSPKFRQELLRIVAGNKGEDSGEVSDKHFIRELISDYRKRGYAWSVGSVEERISAIALPVIINAEPVGAVNIIFFKSALTVEEAAKQFLPALQAAVQAIEQKYVETA